MENIVSKRLKVTGPNGIIVDEVVGDSYFFGAEVVGHYLVELTGEDNDGSESIILDSILVSNSQPVANLNIIKDTDTSYTAIITGSDTDGEVVTYELVVTSPAGLKNIYASGMTNLNLFEDGNWNIVARVFDNDGLASETAQDSIFVELPKLPPVSQLECDYGRNEIICESRSYDSKNSIISYEWSLDGTSSSSNTKSIRFPVSRAGEYEVSLTVTNSDQLSNERVERVEVETIHTNEVSRAEFTFSLSNQHFHNLENDLVINTLRQFFDLESFEKLRISVNNFVLDKGSWEDFSGQITIDSSLLTDGLNELIISGLDRDGDEISKEVYFYAGVRIVNLDYPNIQNLRLESLSEAGETFNFSNTNRVYFVPSDKYLLTVTSNSGSFSEIVNTNNSNFVKTINQTPPSISEMSDLNMESGLSGWQANLGNISINEESENDKVFRSLLLVANASGVGHVQKKIKPVFTDKNFLSYKVEFNSKNIGDQFFFTLSNLNTGKVESFTFEGRTLGKFSKFVTVPIISSADIVLVDAFIKTNGSLTTKNSRNVSFIKSAYAQSENSFESSIKFSGSLTPLEFKFYNLRGDVAGSRKNQRTGDYTPSGISVGRYTDVGKKPLFAEEGQEGRNIFRVLYDSDKIPFSFANENLAVRLRLMKKKEILEPVGSGDELQDIILDEIVKRPVVSRSIAGEFQIELFENDFRDEYHVSHIPDYARVSICEYRSELNSIVENTCVSMSPYLGNKSLEFVVLNRYAFHEKLFSS